MSSYIHGFRVWNFSRCSRTKEIVLRGSAGQHLHNRVQKAAECEGISHALWLTETAQKRLEENYGKKAHEGPSPDWDCSCGAYFFRRLEDAPQAPTNAQAHVTCLERTILHQDGGRTTQYSVDYFLAPKEANIQVFVPVIDTVKAQDQNADVAYSTPAGNLRYGFGVAYPFMLPGEALPYMEVLEEVSASLGVPILDRRDLKGCPVCLEVNGWRKPIEIDEIMMREWFGAGYEQHEKDEAWGDALDAEVSD